MHRVPGSLGKQLAESLHRVLDRRPAHGGAVASKLLDFAGDLSAHRKAKPDGAHRFFSAAAARPGHPGDGHADLRLPNTLNVRFPNSSGNQILGLAPDIAASTGSACHDGHDQASAVIVAMGVAPANALGSVRLTLGRSTSAADIERASAAIIRAFKNSRG